MAQSALRESRTLQIGMLIPINVVIYGGLTLAYAKPLWNLVMILVVGVLASMLSLGQKSLRDLPLLPQFFTLFQFAILACLGVDPTLLHETLIIRNYLLFLFVFPMTLAYATIMTMMPAARRGMRRPSKEGFYSKLADIPNIYPSFPYLSLAVVYMLVLAILDALIF